MAVCQPSTCKPHRVAAYVSLPQETGWRFLRDAGITLIAADSPDAFPDETPTAVMIRQILVAVRKGGGSVPPSAAPRPFRLAKKLARYPTNGRKRSLRDIPAELEAAGHLTSAGTRYSAIAVSRMVAT
jgi:hypothetical protein